MYNYVKAVGLHDRATKKFELADIQGTSTTPTSFGSMVKTLEKGQKTIDLTINVNKADENYIHLFDTVFATFSRH